MSNVIIELEKKGLITPPSWLAHNTHFLCLTGSTAYGCSSDNSDQDVYGWCIPSKEIVFPHLAGEIFGFGNQVKRFEQYQQHHIIDPSAAAGHGIEYDLSIYNIVKFFDLAMRCTPNIIDALYVPENCVIHITSVGHIVRDNRRMFLHAGAFHRFRGYSFSMLKKAKNRMEGKEMKAILLFESEHSLSHGITFKDIESEMNRRGLS